MSPVVNYPWQAAQWEQIDQLFSQQRMPHALLLSGAKGLGKNEFAKQVAQRYFCASHCGHCQHCHLLSVGNHPDFYAIHPEEKSSVIKVDQIRSLSHQLTQTAHLGGYQVAIIYPAEAMNRAAANALLKTLEEPSGKVCLLLVSDCSATIPATITSRCQKMLFHADQSEKTAQWLAEQMGESNQANLMLSLAEGAPLRALQLEQDNFLALRNQLLKDLLNLLQGNQSIFLNTKSYLKQDLMLVTHALFLLANDVAKLQMQVDAVYLANQDCVAQLQQLAQRWQALKVQQFLQKILEAQQYVQSSSHINPELLFEELFYDY